MLAGEFGELNPQKQLFQTLATEAYAYMYYLMLLLCHFHVDTRRICAETLRCIYRFLNYYYSFKKLVKVLTAAIGVVDSQASLGCVQLGIRFPAGGLGTMWRSGVWPLPGFSNCEYSGTVFHIHKP